MITPRQRWSDLLHNQDVARAAAGYPPANAFAQYRSLLRFSEMQMRRQAGKLWPVVAVEGLSNAIEAFSEGPVIVVATHLGMFEAAAGMLKEAFPERKYLVIGGDISDQTVTDQVSKRLDWPVVSCFNPKCYSVVSEWLSDPRGVVILLADYQVPGQHGTPCKYMGHVVELPTGPAWLACTLDSHPSLLPVTTYRVRHGVKVTALPAIWMRSQGHEAMTQELATAMEELITAAPDWWYPPLPFKAVD